MKAVITKSLKAHAQTFHKDQHSPGYSWLLKVLKKQA